MVKWWSFKYVRVLFTSKRRVKTLVIFGGTWSKAATTQKEPVEPISGDSEGLLGEVFLACPTRKRPWVGCNPSRIP